MAFYKKKNTLFFKSWSTEMAYVLGFFAADGSMYVNPTGSYYVSFYSNDLEILGKIRSSLVSENKISKRESSHPRWNTRYVLQLGSKEMYKDLLSLGLVRNKSKVLQFPNIPTIYLGVKFISGSEAFLKTLRIKLQVYANMGAGSLFRGDRSFVLSYAMKDSKKLFAFMYNGVTKKLFLERKYNTFKEAFNNMER